MKKITFTSLLILATAGAANADGFYGSVKGSYASMENSIYQTINVATLNSTIADAKQSDSIGSYKLAAGYSFGELNAELEFSQFSDAKISGDWTLQPEGPTCTNPSCFMQNTYALKTDMMTVFANASYNFNLGYKLKPFAGFGMGYAFIQETGKIHIGDYPRTPINDESADIESEAEKNNRFIWNVSAGAEYSITEKIAVNLSYRYTDLGKTDSSSASGDVKRDMNMHEFILGAKYSF